jgi:hypothetical protein
MTPDEFHKRVTSYIKPFGPEHEKTLKEFIVRPLSPPPRLSWLRVLGVLTTDGRQCQHMSLDNMIQMMGSLPCGSTLKNARETENRGTGIPTISRLQFASPAFLSSTLMLTGGGRIFYMALPPNVFTPVAQHLKQLVYPENGIARLIVLYTLHRYLELICG